MGSQNFLRVAQRNCNSTYTHVATLVRVEGDLSVCCFFLLRMPLSQTPGFRVRRGHTRSDHLLQPGAVCWLVLLMDSKQGPAQQSRLRVSRARSPGEVILKKIINKKMCFENLGPSHKQMAHKALIQQPPTECLCCAKDCKYNGDIDEFLGIGDTQ